MQCLDECIRETIRCLALALRQDIIVGQNHILTLHGCNHTVFNCNSCYGNCNKAFDLGLGMQSRPTPSYISHDLHNGYHNNHLLSLITIKIIQCSELASHFILKTQEI